MQKVTNIRTGETKRIRVVVSLDGDRANLQSDTVTFMLKDAEDDLDSAAVVDVDADVTTNGAHGIADLVVPKTTTDDLTTGKKYYEIIWERSNGEEYVLASDSLYVIGRISDITS